MTYFSWGTNYKTFWQAEILTLCLIDKFTKPNSVLTYNKFFNPLNTELNPICHLLALLGAHHILHVSRIRVKEIWQHVQRVVITFCSVCWNCAKKKCDPCGWNDMTFWGESVAQFRAHVDVTLCIHFLLVVLLARRYNYV